MPRAVAAAFGERALILRAGVILGPGEDVGRLPWWLARMARGGEVLAPGPPDLQLPAGIEPWIELPIRIPPGHEVSALHAAG